MSGTAVQRREKSKDFCTEQPDTRKLVAAGLPTNGRGPAAACIQITRVPRHLDMFGTLVRNEDGRDVEALYTTASTSYGTKVSSRRLNTAFAHTRGMASIHTYCMYILDIIVPHKPTSLNISEGARTSSRQSSTYLEVPACCTTSPLLRRCMLDIFVIVKEQQRKIMDSG